MTSRILTGALALTLLATGSWVMTRGSGAESPLLPAMANAQEAAADPAAATETVEIADMTLGAADAPVEIIEYASYTCPHCADFHNDQFQKLKTEYIDTGKVRFTHREALFDRAALWGTMVARCGGEMRYWGLSGLIYETQQEWIGDGDLAGIAERLRKTGLTAGLSQEQVDACMSDAATAQALIDWYNDNREADDITATPTLIIDGEKHSNMSFEDLAKIIDAKLAE
ncbi:MAG: thiol-disulfide oxidoreductase [Rhodobacterales bacterium]|nr:MAG: thiol-disulfide oxidoreductase [Rhodobacterales bacterium]